MEREHWITVSVCKCMAWLYWNTVIRNWMYCHNCLMTTNCARWCMSVCFCACVLLEDGQVLWKKKKRLWLCCRYVRQITLTYSRSFWLLLSQPAEKLNKTFCARESLTKQSVLKVRNVNTKSWRLTTARTWFFWMSWLCSWSGPLSLSVALYCRYKWFKV